MKVSELVDYQFLIEETPKERLAGVAVHVPELIVMVIYRLLAETTTELVERQASP